MRGNPSCRTGPLPPFWTAAGTTQPVLGLLLLELLFVYLTDTFGFLDQIESRRRNNDVFNTRAPLNLSRCLPEGEKPKQEPCLLNVLSAAYHFITKGQAAMSGFFISTLVEGCACTSV